MRRKDVVNEIRLRVISNLLKIAAGVVAMTLFSLLLLVLGSYILSWMFSSPPAKASEDLSELQQTVRISIPTSSIKWEIFRNEEDAGFLVLGPVDYVKLVAEIVPAERDWFARQPLEAEKLWVAPKAHRSWMSPYFRDLMKKWSGDWPTGANCKAHRTTMTRSDRPVQGLVCEHKGRLLLHIVVSD